jgi:hypothetical protein
MPQLPAYRKALCLLFLIFTVSSTTLISQSTSTRYFQLGLGIPYFNFRDKATSDLAYRGVGLGELTVAFESRRGYTRLSGADLRIGAGLPSPALDNRSDWNKPALAIAINYGYHWLAGLNANTEGKVHYYAGGRIGGNGWLASLPIINNSQSYAWNLLGLEAAGALTYDFTALKERKCRLMWQLSVPLVSYGARPSTYLGLPQASEIWRQDKGLFDQFSSGQFYSLNKILVLRSVLTAEVELRKANRLQLAYDWQFQYNSSAPNTLNAVISSVRVSYLFSSKKHKSS